MLPSSCGGIRAREDLRNGAGNVHTKSVLTSIPSISIQHWLNNRQPINLFAFASWLHLVLARCHPFDVRICSRFLPKMYLSFIQDGNGRTTRLIASIPLVLHGYPPISIPLSARESYIDAINQVCYLHILILTMDCFLKIHSGILWKPCAHDSVYI